MSFGFKNFLKDPGQALNHAVNGKFDHHDPAMESFNRQSEHILGYQKLVGEQANQQLAMQNEQQKWMVEQSFSGLGSMQGDVSFNHSPQGLSWSRSGGSQASTDAGAQKTDAKPATARTAAAKATPAAPKAPAVTKSGAPRKPRTIKGPDGSGQSALV